MPGWDAEEGARVAPAVARNRDAILDVLRRVLPRAGLVLEIASGSGEHAVHFAKALPALQWQPSDLEPVALRSILAHTRAAGLPNLLPPTTLDAGAPHWPVERADAVLAINLIHISPWSAAQGLMAGAGRVLRADGVLFLYGPFKADGVHTAPSNASFDADLRGRDPSWGVRDVEAVARAASSHGLQLVERVAMPANNFSLVFRSAA